MYTIYTLPVSNQYAHLLHRTLAKVSVRGSSYMEELLQDIEHSSLPAMVGGGYAGFVEYTPYVFDRQYFVPGYSIGDSGSSSSSSSNTTDSNGDVDITNSGGSSTAADGFPGPIATSILPPPPSTTTNTTPFTTTTATTISVVTDNTSTNTTSMNTTTTAAITSTNTTPTDTTATTTTTTTVQRRVPTNIDEIDLISLRTSG